ncbi:unnamed protein product [Paramecium octaurelia]|uniref:Tetratricopeptide repeat protein n=1 Tax=Paramecium octaurelia TaxID=43137 RepID=A0A8S1XL79_PAROT|nr:unnamed protein product [Paramecium octaurelia]
MQYDKGFALADINQFLEAIKRFKEDLRYDLAQIGKGSALTKLEQYQDAINCYTEAISINHKFDTAWSGKGQALGSLYQQNEEIECFNQAISINPKYAELLLFCCIGNGYWSESLYKKLTIKVMKHYHLHKQRIQQYCVIKFPKKSDLLKLITSNIDLAIAIGQLRILAVLNLVF